MKTLKDIIDYNLKVLFIGINPSPVSVRKGHYHQGRLGKRFWKRLRDCRILKDSKDGSEDEYLLKNDFGITDIVKRPTRRADSITEYEFSEGAKILKGKILKFKPKMLCFIYKKAAEKLLRVKIKGFGEIDNKFCGIHTFIMPNVYASKRNEKHAMTKLARLLIN